MIRKVCQLSLKPCYTLTVPDLLSCLYPAVPGWRKKQQQDQRICGRDNQNRGKHVRLQSTKASDSFSHDAETSVLKDEHTELN